MFVIDGMDGIEAGYHYAGAVGISPRRMTLRQLWMMAEGAAKAARSKTLELATLVWSLSSVDLEGYLHYGQMAETGSGGPVQLTPEMQARVEAEIERTRRENPDLPSAGGRRNGTR